jgi:hypothetical protein
MLHFKLLELSVVVELLKSLRKYVESIRKQFNETEKMPLTPSII